MTEQITINGFTFLAPCPYTEGHPCTGAEAAILNRKLHANLRSNFSKVMDAYTPQSTSIDDCNREIFKLWSNYCAEYSLNGQDPVQAEAQAIALSIVKRKIKSAGSSIGDYSKNQLNTLAAEILDSHQRQEIFDQARARLKTIRAAAQKELARLST